MGAESRLGEAVGQTELLQGGETVQHRDEAVQVLKVKWNVREIQFLNVPSFGPLCVEQLNYGLYARELVLLQPQIDHVAI